MSLRHIPKNSEKQVDLENEEFMTIAGEFEVKLNPIDSYAKGSGGIKLGRMSYAAFHAKIHMIQIEKYIFFK